MAATLDKDMNRAAFEALVDKTYDTMKATGLPQTREQLAKDMLARLAQRNGMTVEDAEAALDAGAPEEEEPVAAAPKSRKDLAEATKSLRAITSKGPYFFENPVDTAMLDTMIQLNRSAGINANLLITGPSGSGKTEGVGFAASRAGIPFYKIDCASVTTDDKWVGHKEFSPEKGTMYVLSEFLKAVSATDVPPGLVLLDEVNRLHPTRMNILFPLLDGSRSIWVPELGITIEKHPDTIIMATANKGTGFTGTHKMDDALEGRFGFRMERTWPPATEEVKILRERTGIDDAPAKMLVAIANDTRKKAQTDDLPFPVSTRDLLNASALVAAGMTVAEACDWTFVKFYEQAGGATAPRVMVSQIVQGKAAGK
jgi:MoxR-like ATPase